MQPINQRKFRQRVTFLRRQFLQEGDLPFRNVLSEAIVLEALNAVRVVWNDAIYTPLVTLWVFLRQVLSANQSCRAAVAGLVAHRVSQGQRACSSETGAYCQARKRLPENFFAEVARGVGRALDKQATQEWLWIPAPSQLHSTMPLELAIECTRVGFPAREVSSQLKCVCGKKRKSRARLADGKARNIQRMMMTSFWHPYGTPMSSQQFTEILLAKLLEYFHEETQASGAPRHTRVAVHSGVKHRLSV